MTSQWNTKAFGKLDASGNVGGGGLMDEPVVILMQGKNTFGDRIYAYLKITLGDIKRMQVALQQGETFNPSDFGTVLAAGKGEPPPEIRSEISSLYKILDGKSPGAAAPAETPKPKAWDEY